MHIGWPDDQCLLKIRKAIKKISSCGQDCAETKFKLIFILFTIYEITLEMFLKPKNVTIRLVGLFDANYLCSEVLFIQESPCRLQIWIV